MYFKNKLHLSCVVLLLIIGVNILKLCFGNTLFYTIDKKSHQRGRLFSNTIQVVHKERFFLLEFVFWCQRIYIYFKLMLNLMFRSGYVTTINTLLYKIDGQSHLRGKLFSNTQNKFLSTNKLFKKEENCCCNLSIR